MSGRLGGRFDCVVKNENLSPLIFCHLKKATKEISKKSFEAAASVANPPFSILSIQRKVTFMSAS